MRVILQVASLALVLALTGCASARPATATAGTSVPGTSPTVAMAAASSALDATSVSAAQSTEPARHDEATPSLTASPTGTGTPTATLAAPTATSTPAETPAGTPTPAAAPTATSQEVASAGWREQVTVVVFGLPISVALVTHPSLQTRREFAIERIELNRAYYPDAEARLAEIVLRAHWHGWVADEPQLRADVGFEQYVVRVSAGEDMSYRALVDGRRAWVSPLAAMELVFTDESGTLAISEGLTFAFSQGTAGELRVQTQLQAPTRRYFERDYAQDAVAALPYYASYEPSSFIALKALALSEELWAGAPIEERVRRCGEFSDLDTLAYACEAGAQPAARYQALLTAIVREPFYQQ